MKSSMMKRSNPPAFLLAVAIALTLPSLATFAAAQTESIIHTFATAHDAQGPQSTLVMDSMGNLYGAAIYGGVHNSNGAIFKLTPPSAPDGSWTESVIYSFSSGTTGTGPGGRLAIDKAGNLYGVAEQGGDPICQCGTVFKLKPPTVGGGSWQFLVMHTFTGTDGVYPLTGVALDNKGAVYGTTVYGGSLGDGVAYKISSSGSDFTETILKNFTVSSYQTGPFILDAAGNLYGTSVSGGAYGDGSVFKLSPPEGGTGEWVETLLYSGNIGLTGGNPLGALVMDSKGQIYGTNSSGGVLSSGGPGSGTIFRLSPPLAAGGAWTHSTLYTFTGLADGRLPFGGVALNRAKGVLYGTTQDGGGDTQCGVVFSLTPPAIAGGLWTEATLHDFTGSPDGCNPFWAPTLDSAGNLIGTTYDGGTPRDNGAAYKITF